MDKTYGIGGTEVRLDASEAILEIPQNKTLLVEKLTTSTPVKPEIITGLKTIDDVFDKFKPEIEALLNNGATKKFVAGRYKITVQALHDWLKKNKIKRILN